MTDATKLFRSGKRYRGFVSLNGGSLPVTFTAYVVNTREVKLKYIFPSKLFDKFTEGTVLYVLIEDEDRLIGELRITKKDVEKKVLLASLDFTTKDKRKLPRILVKGILDISAKVHCGNAQVEGKVVDISMASMSLEANESIEEQECEVELTYRGRKTKVKGKVVRSDGNSIVIEFLEGNHEITNFLSRIYSDVLLKTQRED